MIIDTDIAVWVLRNHRSATDFLDRIPLVERNLSAISHLELLYGSRTATELSAVQQLVSDLFAEVIPLSEIISDWSRQLMQRFVLSRRPDPEDALIAATALSRGEAVATGNVKHFNFIPGLSLKVFRP